MSFLGQGRMRNPAPVLVPDSGTQNGSSFRTQNVQIQAHAVCLRCGFGLLVDWPRSGCSLAANCPQSGACCLQSHGFLVAVCLQSGGCLSAAQWQSGCHLGATWLGHDWRLHAVGLGSRCSSGAVLTSTGIPRPQHVPLATSELTTDILVLPEQCSNGTFPPKNGAI